MKKTLCNRCRLCQLCRQDGGLAQETPGVKTAAVNFMTQKMAIEFEPGADAGTVMKASRNAAKKSMQRLRS